MFLMMAIMGCPVVVAPGGAGVNLLRAFGVLGHFPFSAAFADVLSINPAGRVKNQWFQQRV
jgi:hypothetical protein